MRLCINMLIFTHNLGNWLIVLLAVETARVVVVCTRRRRTCWTSCDMTTRSTFCSAVATSSTADPPPSRRRSVQYSATQNIYIRRALPTVSTREHFINEAVLVIDDTEFSDVFFKEALSRDIFSLVGRQSNPSTECGNGKHPFTNSGQLSLSSLWGR